jgi:hypothetical protein
MTFTRTAAVFSTWRDARRTAGSLYLKRLIGPYALKRTHRGWRVWLAQ